MLNPGRVPARRGGESPPVVKYWAIHRGAERMDRPLEAQVRATLNMIPAYTWYAAQSGALTFVNERFADYLGLAKDHPLRSGADTGAAWDSHLPLLHLDDREETRKVWSECLKSGRACDVAFRVRDAEGNYRRTRWSAGDRPARLTDRHRQ